MRHVRPIGLPFLSILPAFLIPFAHTGYSVAGSADDRPAQTTLSGTIRNAETGEFLIGATVILRETGTVGATSNAYGFYSLTVPPGKYSLSARYSGFEPLTDSVTLSASRHLDFALKPRPVQVEEIEVSGRLTEPKTASTHMGLHQVDGRAVRATPVLMGESDVLKTIQLLPGIKPEGEGRTGLFARGGAADQNLILLDEAPVYNASHLLGFVSVFNADAVKDVTAVTGGMPAEYGGRLSSVIDIRTSDGNAQEFGGAAGIGLVASRATLEGPLGKGRGSFFLSARRTYVDLLLGLSKNPTLRGTSLYFHDLNVKANYGLGERDRLYLSGYLGRDHFTYPDVLGFDWGNTIATLRWNHLFSDRLFSNTTFIYSSYRYTNSLGSGITQFDIASGIRDLHLKSDFQLFLPSGRSLKFGLQAVDHRLTPGDGLPGPLAAAGYTLVIPPRRALEGNAYLSLESALSTSLKFQAGLRLSGFSLAAPDSAPLAGGLHALSGLNASLRRAFWNLEPRVALNLRLDDESALKTSYARTVQYLHLVTNPLAANPTSLWIPSSSLVRPAYADQVSLGYFRNFDAGALEGSVELYYKDMRNLLEPGSGVEIMLNPALESSLLSGHGWSYGAEFLLRKTAGSLTGWIAYTLSRAEEQFPGIDNGRPFPARQDRTHDCSVVLMYEASSRWHCSATWVYSTGGAITFPSGNYFIEGRLVPYFTSHNRQRLPAYHRLDLSITYAFTERSRLNLTVYNVYNRANAFMLMFKGDHVDPRLTYVTQLTLFPIIPSLSYEVSF